MSRLEPLPSDIPKAPDQKYADEGWKDWGDWLGTGTVATHLRNYRSLRAARNFARKLKLKGAAEWLAFCKGKMPKLGHLPADIPNAPNQKYANEGWKGWGDWLGTGNVANFLKKYRPFFKARAFVRQLKLKNRREWRAFCNSLMPQSRRLPPDIPRNPWQTYANKGWQGLGDWLGIEEIENSTAITP
jgi:hypothetical protein